MDPITQLQRAIDQTGQIVANVKPDQMTDPTPCTDWDVRALVNHTLACVEMFDGAAQGAPFDMTVFERDNVGGDPGASYDAQAAKLRATIDKPGAVDATWTMPFGEVSGVVGASFAALELAQHGWDVARATGQQPDFDPELTEAALATARMAPADQVRVPGVYGPESPCPPGTDLADQLAAFLGRSV